jgi:hypothetical protein
MHVIGVALGCQIFFRMTQAQEFGLYKIGNEWIYKGLLYLLIGAVLMIFLWGLSRLKPPKSCDAKK